MKHELISIIMSTYKEPSDWVKTALESILNQSYSHFELLIVIDDPTNIPLIDYLKQASSRDSRIQLLHNPKNIGLVESLNSALQHCNGNYIARMDADDISHSTRLEKQISFLQQNPTSHIVGSFMQRIDENGKNLSVANIPYKAKKVRQYAKYNTPSFHPTWMVKKEVYQLLKGYREVKHAEDYDFLLRALENNFEIENLPEILFDYRINSQSLSNQNSLIQQQTKRIIQKLFIKNKLSNSTLETINMLLPPIAPSDLKSSHKANTYFIKALQQRQQGKWAKTLLNLFLSFSTHKSQRQRFFDILIHQIFIRI